MPRRAHLTILCALALFGCEVDVGDDQAQSGDQAAGAAGGRGSVAGGGSGAAGNESSRGGASGFGGGIAGGSTGAPSSGGEAGGSGGGEAGGGVAPSSPEVARVIEEADILKLEGDLLYALSRDRDFFVINIADPEDLQIIGSFPFEGEPFEMYLRDGVVFVLAADLLTDRVIQDGGIPWGTRLVALDVRTPEQIRALSEVSVRGEISDSRLVDDVLYAATYDTCENCRDWSPRIFLSALSVADPTALTRVDQLSFPADAHAAPSVYLNSERAYIADKSGAQSRVTIVDISDPGGRLLQGDTITVHGAIESRWQMNEYQHVLRIISQPLTWGDPPRLETFEINANRSSAPLAALDLVLPEAEDLRSVRFDGPRAYAVTFPSPPPPPEVEVEWDPPRRDERYDPLFILDLSVPSAPRQRGELIIPGWIYHMEPHGDRLVTVGLSDARGSSLAVSLYDVSDMDAPSQISRVELEGTGAIEDQDRVHKAFKVDGSRGLILMPFQTQGRFSGEDEREGQYQSGVQIIDWVQDMLIKRGVAYHRGLARRSFLRDNWLFALSDEALEVFEISLRNHPQFMSEAVF